MNPSPWSEFNLPRGHALGANGQKIAQYSGTTLNYLFADHLGSSTRMTNTSGTVVRTQSYKPYGSDAAVTGTATTKYQYTGQEKDTGGLYYYNARYYDPELGRFTQPDPAVWDPRQSAQLSLEEQINPYLYALNNPVKYTDPTGLVQAEGVNTVAKDDEKTEEFFQDVDSTPDTAPRLTQNDLRPDKPMGPCTFVSIVDTIQLKAGENLTLSQYLALARYLHEQGDIGSEEEKEFYYVNRPEAVAEAAARALGYRAAKVDIGNATRVASGTADYTIRFMKQNAHFQVGDALGRLLVEPFRYAVPSNSQIGPPTYVREVRIRLGEQQ